MEKVVDFNGIRVDISNNLNIMSPSENAAYERIQDLEKKILFEWNDYEIAQGLNEINFNEIEVKVR